MRFTSRTCKPDQSRAEAAHISLTTSVQRQSGIALKDAPMLFSPDESVMDPGQNATVTRRPMTTETVIESLLTGASVSMLGKR